MRLQRRSITVASVGAAAILAVGLTAGAASATGSTAPANGPTVTQLSKVTKTAADTDNVQQGDQTTPDVPGSHEKPGTETADNQNAGTEKPGTETADDQKPGAEKPGTETADNQNAGNEKPGTEKPDGNDGPGGHADAPGTVHHQFKGKQ